VNVAVPTHDARSAEAARPSSTTLASDESYQEQALPGVSRTFALTIPELPGDLRRVVTNAYLLCRIADTIEDDGELSADEKQRLHEQFVAVVADQDNAERFAQIVVPLLSPHASQAERDLVRNAARVVRVTHSFNPTQRRALERCVRIMCQGMPGYQRNKSLAGLASLEELNNYCYYVAGVVGEMLTELFCEYSPEINLQREPLLRHAVRFGQTEHVHRISAVVADIGREVLDRRVEQGDAMLMSEPRPCRLEVCDQPGGCIFRRVRHPSPGLST